MSAGDLPTVDYLGTVECHTPACGRADVWRIGRLTRVVCQKCAGNWPLYADEQPAPPLSEK